MKVLLSFFLLIALISCNQNKQETEKAEKKFSINDVVTFKDSKWVVLEFIDAGNSLQSNNQFVESATTEGKFVIIKYNVTNLTNKEENVLIMPKLKDSKNREFKAWTEGNAKSSFYLPEKGKSLFAEPLPAGVSKTFYEIYEVPKDAENLQFQARALQALGDEQYIQLGQLKVFISSVEEDIKAIKVMYADIKNNINTYEKIDDQEGTTSYTYYFKANDIKLISTGWSEPSGEKYDEYYYKGKKIFFIFISESMFQQDKEGNYSDKKVNKTENRYYFKNDKMIQWIKNKNIIEVNSQEFKSKEKELIEESLKLMNFAYERKK